MKLNTQTYNEKKRMKSKMLEMDNKNQQKKNYRLIQNHIKIQNLFQSKNQRLVKKIQKIQHKKKSDERRKKKLQYRN